MFYYLKGFFRINTIKTRHNKCFYKSLSIYNEKVFCTPGLWTKPFEHIFYRSINNIYMKFDASLEINTQGQKVFL